MADISKINVNNTDYDIKDTVARGGLSDKMDKSNPTGTGALSINRKANTNIGEYSTAEGLNCEASGNYSHAEGTGTTASGTASHAEGSATTATGNYSHAEGYGTVANHKCQHVYGEYNIEDASSATSSNRGNYVEIVGNGTASGSTINYSNARTLDWDGNETLAGDLFIYGNISVANAIRNLHITSSVSGSVASFTDGSNNIPLKTFTIPIVATQSGSGTPSPTNVRPINGVDTVVVSHTGKNWFNKRTITRDKNMTWASGAVGATEIGSWVSDFILVKPNETYIASDTLSQVFAYDSTQTAVYVWKSSGWSAIGGTGNSLGTYFTIPEGISYIRFSRRNTEDIDTDIASFQVEKGTSRTAFDYYDGGIYTTQISQTVYYGTYNVVNGTIQVDKVCVTLDPSATWTKNVAITTSNAYTAAAFFDNYKQENGLCSHFGTVSSVSATEGIYFGSNINIFTPLSLGLNTVEKFTQWITGKNIQVLYTLDIPFVIVLPEVLPEQQQAKSITTNLGINNICSDANDVNVTYFNQNADPFADLIRVLTQ